MKRIQDWCLENGKELLIEVSINGAICISGRNHESIPLEGWTYETPGIWYEPAGHDTLDEAFDAFVDYFDRENAS